MQLLGIGDLLKLWIYKRHGLAKWRKKPDFPMPVQFVNQGRTPLWDAADISVYETKYPELKDAEAKRRKVRAYAVGQLNKSQRAAR